MPFLSDDLRKLFAVLEYSKDWKNSKAAESNQKNSDISHISRGCDDVTWSNGTTNLPTTIWTKEAPTTLQQDHLEWSRQSRKWAHNQQNMCVIPSQHMHVKCLQYRVLYGTNQDHGVRVRATDATFGRVRLEECLGQLGILKGCDWIRVIIYSIYEVYIGRPIGINHRFSHVMIGDIWAWY